MKKETLLIYFFLLSSLIFTGCSSGDNVTGQVIKEIKPLQVGIFLQSSDESASYNEQIKRGIELANGALGFVISYKEIACTEADTEQSAKEFLEEKKSDVFINGICKEQREKLATILKEETTAILPLKTASDSNNIEPFVSQTIIGRQLANRYRQEYGEEPSRSTADAYDIMLAISQAKENSDGTKDGLKTALKEVQFEGATGNINFEE